MNDEKKVFFEKISKIQAELKAPKGQYNSFGKYSYRNCEDILEAVKPLLNDLIITISDEVELVGDRYYIKATAKISDGENYVSNVAYAREPLHKKGMDEAQVTGATSSYARKYALNGLLCIDDTKDADSRDNSSNQNNTSSNTNNKTSFVMPFGNQKGTPFSEIDSDNLKNTLKWCQDNNESNKFATLISNISLYLSEKENGKG